MRLLSVALGWLVLALATAGCRDKTPSSEPNAESTTELNSAPNANPASSAADEVLLTGNFEQVARTATGTASIVRRGEDYVLRLHGVTTSQKGQVRVYLVGHPHPKDNKTIDETEMKYDMADLERGAVDQDIALPSAPDPALRSVVLFLPSLAVNLAVAPLGAVR